MIVCNRCGKENQNHYKFCLGCGAELSSGPPAAAPSGDAGVGMMKTMMADPQQQAAASLPRPSGPPAVTNPPPAFASAGAARPAGPPPGVASPPPGYGAPAAPGYGPPPVSAGWPAQGRPSAGVPAAAAPAGHAAPVPTGPTPAMKQCPTCGADVPINFKFCGACGSAIPASAPAAAAPAAAAVPRSHMTLIRPDGSEGGSFPLQAGENRIGRSHGALFENDGYLSPTHATITVQGSSAIVRDEDSLNGVFVRMSEEEEILPGQILRIGQELLRFDVIEPPAPLDDGTEVMGSPNPGFWGKITVVIGNGIDGSAYPLLGDAITLGRERGDINFPDDGYVSGLHARLTIRGGRVYLSDLGSSNGTFLKLLAERKLASDSFVLLGQQLFRLTLR
jgi:hypothetical protein